MNFYKFHLSLAMALLFFTGACATPQRGGMQSALNPVELVKQLKEELSDARSKQLDVLSPTWFGKAEKNFDKAGKALKEGEQLSEIQARVNEARAQLQQADEIGKVSRTILSDVIAARSKAREAGAVSLGEPYQAVEERFLSLTRAVENNNIRFAQENSMKVLKDYQNLEIRSIQSQTLGNAKAEMAKAESVNAQHLAPKTYGQTQKQLTEAEAFIAKNPYDIESKSQRSLASQFTVQRLLSVTDSSKRFNAMTPEQSALYLENLLADMSNAMAVGDIRNKPVNEQVHTLMAAAQKLREENRAMASRIESQEKERATLIQSQQSTVKMLEKRISDLQGVTQEQNTIQEQLAADKRFNDQFNEVQSFFSPEEAEVYKRGNQLVIRLRTIKFAVGKAMLTPDNYGLLSKVQRAIRLFDKPRVIIEGHTDSTGSVKTNLNLSRQRAEAVLSYLVANQTLAPDHIEAKGYGSDRPLASNSTPEGRAINRRIDVVVIPADRLDRDGHAANNHPL